MSELLRLLECPVCMETMTPPIFICQNGHSICNRCLPKLEKCPTCRECFTSTRNLFAESLAEQSMLPCQFASGGCQAKLFSSNMSGHEAVCPFSPIKCLAGTGVTKVHKCVWKGLRSELAEHVEKAHKLLLKAHVLKEPVLKLEATKDFCATRLVSAHGELFWHFVRYKASRQNYMEVLRYIGSSSGAQHFKSRHVLASSEDEQIITFENRVHSDCEDAKKLAKAGQCFALDFAVMKKFLKNGRIQGYTLNILALD